MEKKSSAEYWRYIKSEKEKLMPSKGAILNVTKENLQLTSDTKTILMRYCFMTFQVESVS